MSGKPMPNPLQPHMVMTDAVYYPNGQGGLVCLPIRIAVLVEEAEEAEA